MNFIQEMPCSFDSSVFADPSDGHVTWSAKKSIWWVGMTLTWITFAPSTLSLSSLLVFIVLSAATLCLGHSLGMHRKLIHRSFECPKWLERLFVYLSSLVGLGGPFTMMHTHDTRDWAQRLPRCHPFLSHQSGIVRDFYWQLNCKLHLANPPQLVYPESVSEDRFYRFLQHTSIGQQALLASLLYWLGGWPWIVWGICGRVSISVFGHWLIGYFAHNSGHRSWHLNHVAVQGYNVNRMGWISFGECWHNNHHAFPGSAKLGLNKNQIDPGWLVLKALNSIGLVWNLKTPENLEYRENLVSLESKKEQYGMFHKKNKVTNTSEPGITP